jgi:multidrug efflux system membrane fusion protein
MTESSAAMPSALAASRRPSTHEPSRLPSFPVSSTFRQSFFPLMYPAKALLFLASTLALTGCRPATAPQQRTAPPVPVILGEVRHQDLAIYLRSVGTVQASATVTVKPRVSGLLAAAEFEEGQEVEAGAILFRIDPRPYEVALDKAQANLTQLREQAANAEEQEKRYLSIGSSGAVTREQLATVRTTARASAAAEQAGEAAVKEAEIQLDYCTIRSPIAGRTGRRMIDVGNVVTANTSELVVVNRVAPIDVLFAVPEQRLAEIEHQRQAGKLQVDATPAGQKNRPAQGELHFVDNTVNPNTGTIDLQARFSNADRTLWPGQFAEVRLALGMEKNALVVPAAAVQVGPKGHFLYVLRADQTVEMRSVEQSRTLEQQAVLSRGVSVGEKVVVEGQLRLVPGSKVVVKEHAPAASQP